MTPKEKAKEIINKCCDIDFEEGKYMALIELEGRVDSINNILKHDKERYGIISRGCTLELMYLKEVKQEIENIINKTL